MSETSPSQVGYTRRSIVTGAVGLAGAAIVGLGRESASAVSLWAVAAGASGGITQDWHNDTFTGSLTALDIGAPANAAVAIYVRISGTSTYGYFFHTGIHDSCEYLSNPGQKKLLFDIGTNSSSTSIFGTAAYTHVFPYSLAAGQSAQASRQIATIGSGTTQVYFPNGTLCYSAPHLHQSANGSYMHSPNPSPASAGNTEYWYWWV